MTSIIENQEGTDFDEKKFKAISIQLPVPVAVPAAVSSSA
jgi:hypothetical protein